MARVPSTDPPAPAPAPAPLLDARTAEPALQPTPRSAYWILVWLCKLRWGAILGQFATVLVVHELMGIDLPLVPLVCIISLEAASNLILGLWLKREPEVPEWSLGAVMAADVLALTALLYTTGGPFNPFSSLYLVHIALAAAVLRDRYTWGLVALSTLCFGALFSRHASLDLGADIEPARMMDHMRMHLEGMWVAFAVTAGFIAYFVSRVRRALAARERDLAATREVAARAERLASLTTLAAGAAHELSTPLGTIAVAATELEIEFQERVQGEPELLADLQLIRHEVDRCRQILDQMAAEAGESTGDPLNAAPVSELLERAKQGLPDGAEIRIAGDEATLSRTLFVPLRAVEQALRALFKNAWEASPAEEPPVVAASADAEFLYIEVCDRGPGMSEETLARIGEPFFTTKEAGQGMGLGVFLARTVLAGLGGGLRVDSQPGSGTRASATLPLACGNLPPSPTPGAER